jgi:hypothetical protein
MYVNTHHQVDSLCRLVSLDSLDFRVNIFRIFECEKLTISSNMHVNWMRAYVSQKVMLSREAGWPQPCFSMTL